MTSLKDYILNEMEHTQINPYLQRDIPDLREPYDKQSITSSKDIIHVEFKYKDKKYSYDIKYKELDFGTSDNIHWHVKKKSDDLTFDIHAQKPGTGRFNATIIHMMVDVFKDKKKIDTIEPRCEILSYSDDNLPLEVDFRNT